MHPRISSRRPAGADGAVSACRPSPLRVTFRDAQEFAREYDDNLSNMGLFVPTTELRPVREVVDFVIIVPTRRDPIPGRGEVIYTLDAEQAAARGAQPGLGLQILQFDMQAAADARRRVREALADEALRPPEQRRAVRIPARVQVRYRTRAEFEEGVTRDISMGGLFLRTEEPFPVGTAVQIVLVRPIDGEELVLEGTVARTPLVTSEDGPKIGMGIAFRPLTDLRRQELERYVRYHGLRHRARTAREVRGHARDTGVESVIHLFCQAERDGELVLRRGPQSGRIVFKDARVVGAELPGTCVRGEKAFYRMMTWVDSEFEYRGQRVAADGDMDQPGDRLVREGLRIRSEVDEWSRRIPADRRVAAGPSLPGAEAHMPDGARELIALLPSRPDVASVIDRIGRSDLEAYRLLGELQRAGVVQLQ